MTETFVNALGDADPWAELDTPQATGLLPEEFWNARDTFKHVRQAAYAEARSGDVLLYTTLVRLSGMVDHRIKMRTGILGRGSLNLYAALVGAPGAGKSSGASGARELIRSNNPEFRDALPLGSGEGIAEVFMGFVEEETGELHRSGPHKGDPVMAKVRKQVRHNAFFYVDEGERLTQLNSRLGQTLAETLRSAAMGDTLGQTNASEDRTRYIAPGTYSLGLVIGYQPTTVTALLADGHTGSPQRFFWVRAEDPSIPFNPPEHPGPLSLDPRVENAGRDTDIEFPKSVQAMIRAERVQRARGEIEVPQLDGHHRFMTAKMAALLALIEGRFAVDETDWALAEMAWGASCALRNELVSRASREAMAARERDDDAKILLEVRAHGAKLEAELRLQRVAMAVRRAVKKAGVGGATYNGVKMGVASRDRDILEEAIAYAVAHGWIFEDGERYCLVDPETPEA